MNSPTVRLGLAIGLVTLGVVSASPAAQRRGGAPPAAQTSPDTVPADLRPLLAPRRSEMRLVTERYTLDRATLEGNYAGAPGGPGAPAAVATISRPRRRPCRCRSRGSSASGRSIGPGNRRLPA